jgi:type IV pilus assembly protein PilM
MGIFSKNAVGLDIADSSIEVISLDGNKNDIEILSKGRIKLDPGIVERGRIKDSKKLGLALKKVLKEAKPKPIKTKDFFVVLPEAVCFTCVVDLEGESGTNVFDIAQEAHSLIPLLASESTISHKINKFEKESRALVIATENSVLAEWHDFFKKQGFDVNGFDSEPLALYRGLFSERNKNNVAIVDIGAFNTNISIFLDGFLKHAYSMDTAGENISQSLMSSLSISKEEAEKIKKNKGLSDVGSKESQIITKALDQISNSLEETLPYFQNKFKKEIQEVVLVGGTSAMPGIDEYFEANLGFKIRVGSSFVFKKQGVDSLLYIEAIGLAIRGLNNEWEDSDPLLEFDESRVVLKEDSVTNSSTTVDSSEKKELSKESPKKAQIKKSKMSELPLRTQILLGIVILSLLGLLGIIFFGNDKEESIPEEVLEKLEAIDEIPILVVETESKVFVIIDGISTGWLNVREAPGAQNEEIARVNPDEEYELLDEEEDWYKIKIDQETEGWISSEYANIKNEKTEE